MFRIVATLNSVRYIKRTLAGEGRFTKMHYEQRPWILFFVPSVENENDVASLLINLADRGFVVKFVYWNEGPEFKAEKELEETNERNIISSGAYSSGVADTEPDRRA
jgi:hypothetical protein